jgi:tetratricopeptide (TPR) repeat protein
MLIAVLWWTVRWTPPPPAAQQASAAARAAHYVGSAACASCHAAAYGAWKGSQHARAMQPATADTVLGDFDHARFRYAGVVSTFFRRDGRFFVRTDGADGRLADFEVLYTFGVAPLQQYLIPFPDGRLQALSIAWDSRPRAQGGQRWFHLYPKDKIDHRDELHWTRRAQNWNYMCADCHSTDLRKNYNAASDTYRTTWQEMSVGCEACHGPGSAHLHWADSKSGDTGAGLGVALGERAGARWTIDPATGNAVRSRPRAQDTEVDVCAPCHARRGQIGDGYRAGLAWQDFYRPALLSPDLYYADGQQRDEVYNWGSFLQSRMYHAGVTCSDCHEPHGQGLRASGNGVCAGCHLPSKYATPTHHHHAGEGAGTQCVDCHMPTSLYMVIDARRDHSLRIPRPDLSIVLGTPNACNGCHRNKNAQWAASVVERWTGHAPRGYQRYAQALADAARDAAQASGELARVAGDSSHPAIARASAIEALARYAQPATMHAARNGLTAADALVRRASIGALAPLPPDQRLPWVAPLLLDPVRSVRMEAAYVLADARDAFEPTQRAAFDRAAAEYEGAQRFNADRPEGRVALGNFYARQGRLPEAQAQLQSALTLDPTFVPAYVNLADVWRVLGRDADGERTLRDGLGHAAGAAALHHALGLTLIRLHRNTEALAELRRAAQIDGGNARFAYVYAVALQSAGQLQVALAELDRALVRHPEDRDLLIAAVSFRRDRGDTAGARRYVERLSRHYPEDPGVARLARELSLAP